jgi:glycosyltransferase involved in cell wall biosynthesis
MKIIALMLVKNEGWILKSTLPSLFNFVDHLIVLDGGSTDDTVEIVESFGGVVMHQTSQRVTFSDWRQVLLDAGRAQGGTHFVFLDADEALISLILSSQ